MGRISPWCLLPLVVLGLLLMPLLVAPLFWALALLLYLSTRVTLTQRRVVAFAGLIPRPAGELDLGLAESIRVDQSALGRLLGFGTIVVSGAGNPQVAVGYIRDPHEFRRRFLELLDSSESLVNSRLVNLPPTRRLLRGI